MIPEIDTSSVVDETKSAKVTTESQMAECSTELMRRPETTDGRWIPAGMQGCLAGLTLMNAGCRCDDQAGQQHEPADGGARPCRTRNVRHDRNLKIDPLWYTQPMKNCESVGDVVIAAKPKHQTSRSVEDRLELSL